MRTIFACGLSLVFSVLFSCCRVHAAWELRRVDTHTHYSSTRLARDLAAYRKQGDLYLHRISSGIGTRVTHDSYAKTDQIIDLEGETLYYWSRDPYTSIYDLHRYFTDIGRDEWLFSFDALIAPDEGTAGARGLVIWKDHDWFLVRGYSLECLTFSGEGLCKQLPWLVGDYLVWRAVCGTPGVYVTYLPSKVTTCIHQDEVPPTSLLASGSHAAWVAEPDQTGGEYTIFHHRFDTGTTRVVGTSEERVWWQLAIEPPQMIWLKKEGPSWQVMLTNLEDGTNVCLFSSEVKMNTPRVSGDDILLVTRNCQGGYELCSELNVLDQETGILTQLTRFGADSVISSPGIDTGGIAFTRRSMAFPFIHEVYVGVETPEPTGWGPSNASGSDRAVNLALLLPPLAIPPWLQRRRIRHRQSAAS